jgi:ABC-type sugar transport system ATPase subunit
MHELIGLCDRVLVVREGLINGEAEGEALTEETIIRLASFTERATHPQPGALQ